MFSTVAAFNYFTFHVLIVLLVPTVELAPPAVYLPKPPAAAAVTQENACSVNHRVASLIPSSNSWAGGAGHWLCRAPYVFMLKLPWGRHWTPCGPACCTAATVIAASWMSPQESADRIHIYSKVNNTSVLKYGKTVGVGLFTAETCAMTQDTEHPNLNP